MNENNFFAMEFFSVSSNRIEYSKYLNLKVKVTGVANMSVDFFLS